MKQPAVYLMASQRNGTLYVGVTSDLIKRVWQHSNHVVEGFTKKYGIGLLVWYEQHEIMESAISREKAIKKWNRAWKLRLIEKTNPNWLDLWPVITGEQADFRVLHLCDTAPQFHVQNSDVPTTPVIPAQAGIQRYGVSNDAKALDSRLRGNDDNEGGES